MCALSRLFSMGVLVVLLAILTEGNAVALKPYAPAADTYTDINAQDASHGEDQYLLLSASNLAGCVETTYLWFKFDVPSLGTTIADASLDLTFGPGAGTVDLELRGSVDVSWNEIGLTWSNQPALDGVLATATGVTPGSTATFGSAALTAYLSARQGQTVSLVVRADCDGSVSTSVALALSSRDNPGGSGASLMLIAIEAACPDFMAPSGVDVGDVQYVAARWRQGAAGQPYDLDGDEWVTIADIMGVAARWGDSCPEGGH